MKKILLLVAIAGIGFGSFAETTPYACSFNAIVGMRASTERWVPMAVQDSLQGQFVLVRRQGDDLV